MLLGFISAFQRKKKKRQAEGNREKQWIFHFDKRDSHFWQTTLWDWAVTQSNEGGIPVLLGYHLQEYLFGRDALAAPIAVSIHQVTQRSVTQVSLMGLDSIPPFLLKINAFNVYSSQSFISWDLSYKHSFPSNGLSVIHSSLFVVRNKVITNL